MSLISKIKNTLRGAKQRWGTVEMKRRLWNQEFASGRWASIANTPGDVVYGFVQKYARRGSILDLGCGSGNTSCELEADSYTQYTGIDISDVAVAQAKARSQACQRGKKNQYFQGDIATYSDETKYDVILFRESIYYIPRTQIIATLKMHTLSLKQGGVFVVRTHQESVAADLLDLIGREIQIVEQYKDPTGPVVLVFRMNGSK